MSRPFVVSKTRASGNADERDAIRWRAVEPLLLNLRKERLHLNGIPYDFAAADRLVDAETEIVAVMGALGVSDA